MSDTATHHWQVTFIDSEGVESYVYVHAGDTEDDAIKVAKRTHRKEAKGHETVTAYPIAELSDDRELLSTKELRERDEPT